jgi:hypothetical protein
MHGDRFFVYSENIILRLTHVSESRSDPLIEKQSAVFLLKITADADSKEFIQYLHKELNWCRVPYWQYTGT